ncbi:MAG: LamG domain-containing protein [Candidatus Omnitrophica bacterium]|nr:LamG domain-containing protein [Candidatus Omnitrophota bacterium]
MKKTILLAIIGVFLMGTNAFAVVGIDAYTVLMLHFDGDDGSTDFMDSSFSNHTVTAHGNAQIDTAESKFGGASGLFDGYADYLTVSDSDDWYFNEDFTIDFWTKFNALPTGASSYVIGSQLTGIPGHQWELYFHEGPGIHRFRLYVVKNNTSYFVVNSDYESYSVDTWYHIALTRNDDWYKIFIDGMQDIAPTYNTFVWENYAANLQIGSWGATYPEYALNGWLDEFRISKGIARWTSDFTPPTSEYEVIPESSSLILLGLGLLGTGIFKRKVKS